MASVPEAHQRAVAVLTAVSRGPLLAVALQLPGPGLHSRGECAASPKRMDAGNDAARLSLQRKERAEPGRPPAVEVDPAEHCRPNIALPGCKPAIPQKSASSGWPMCKRLQSKWWAPKTFRPSRCGRRKHTAVRLRKSTQFAKRKLAACRNRELSIRPLGPRRPDRKLAWLSGGNRRQRETRLLPRRHRFDNASCGAIAGIGPATPRKNGAAAAESQLRPDDHSRAILALTRAADRPSVGRAEDHFA